MLADQQKPCFNSVKTLKGLPAPYNTLKRLNGLIFVFGVGCVFLLCLGVITERSGVIENKKAAPLRAASGKDVPQDTSELAARMAARYTRERERLPPQEVRKGLTQP